MSLSRKLEADAQAVRTSSPVLRPEARIAVLSFSIVILVDQRV
jgi:hypothetical protein